MPNTAVITHGRIAIIGLVLVTTAGCLLGIGGCTDEKAAALNEIEHYAGAELEPEDDGLGNCGASFTTRDDPSVVIEHYRSALADAGWTIDPPEGDPPPAPPPSGMDDVIEGRSISLGAHRGRMLYTVSAELFGQPETTFVIHVGESTTP